MRIRPAGIEDVHVIEFDPFVDFRGYFVRSYCETAMAAANLNCNWPQENLSYTSKRGMVRGMHYQRPPAAEIKLIRCVSGAVYDVVVDLRPRSPTFGRWTAVELSEASHRALYVPAGFAHGFQCLTNDCRLHYHMSVPYDAALYAGVRWNDADLGISWPIGDALVSDKDASLPLMSEIR